jgi:hypothetical protein
MVSCYFYAIFIFFFKKLSKINTYKTHNEHFKSCKKKSLIFLKKI